MASEAPEAISAAEKTKQARAASRQSRQQRAAAVQERRLARQEKTEARLSQAEDARQERVQKDGDNPSPPTQQTSTSSSGPSLGRMSPKSGHTVIASAWLAGLAVISWQEIKANSAPPAPNKLTGWSAAMAILDLLAPLISVELAGVFAVGLALGLLFFRSAATSTAPSDPDPNANVENIPGTQGATNTAAQAAQKKGTLTPQQSAAVQRRN